MFNFTLRLKPGSPLPLYVQIARALAADIRRGAIRGGTKLPGSRRLATSLEVHRNTVLAALAELEQEGFIVTRPRRGTYVREELGRILASNAGESVALRRKKAGAVSDLLTLAPSPLPDPVEQDLSGLLALVGGLPDTRLIRRADLARSVRRALLSSPSSLEYGSPWGDLRLRNALARFLGETRGVATTPERVLITRGSQMALYLAAQALVQPGDTIAVEEWGYPPAWQALRMAGARLVPIAVDAQGVRVDSLRQACEASSVRAVYVTPHHQFPTTVTLSASRREQLISLARERRIAILEDDYDHEQHYSGRPVLPLASQESDVVLYIGTFSKVLAPGLRVGYAVGPRALLQRMAALRTFIDRQGDVPVERALAEWIEEGDLQRHTRRVTRHSHERRDALVDALRHYLGGELRFKVPNGGMALWATARVSTEAWAKRALAEGVFVQPGRNYRFDGIPGTYLRIGFGALTPDEIAEAVRRLARARHASRSR